MRRIEPLSSLSQRGIKHATVGVDLPELVWVAPRSILIEDSYQRDLAERSIALVRRIIAGWNWAHVKPIICVASERDGEYFAVDGQHTAIAAATLGIPSIPAMVVKADTVEQRAIAFVAQNRDRVALTPWHMHYAGLAASEGTAVKVDQAARKAGVRVLRCPPSGSKHAKDKYKVGDTLAVGVLCAMVESDGVDTTAAVLQVLVRAGRAPVAAHEIKAVAFVLKAGIVASRLAEIINASRPMELIAEATKMRAQGEPTRSSLARVLIERCGGTMPAPQMAAPETDKQPQQPKPKRQVIAKKVNNEDSFEFVFEGGAVVLSRAHYLVADRLMHGMPIGPIPVRNLLVGTGIAIDDFDTVLWALRDPLARLGFHIDYIKPTGYRLKRKAAA